MSLTAAALLCLSSVVHHEARGEPLEGRVAVASVVLNRVESPHFPNTVCGVVKQDKQFKWYPLTYGKQRHFAKDFLTGKYKRLVPRSYFFTTLGSWLNRPVRKVIGNHRFYGM